MEYHTLILVVGSVFFKATFYPKSIYFVPRVCSKVGSACSCGCAEERLGSEGESSVFMAPFWGYPK